jgi:hypothetical protein
MNGFPESLETVRLIGDDCTEVNAIERLDRALDRLFKQPKRRYDAEAGQGTAPGRARVEIVAVPTHAIARGGIRIGGGEVHLTTLKMQHWPDNS